MPSPTYKDIARAARVSTATVSRALANHPSVSEAKRDSVRRAAEKLGFRSNPLVTAHMAYVRKATPPKYRATISLVTAFRERADSWNLMPIWKRYHDGAKRRAESLGYKLEPFWLKSPNMTDQRASSILRDRGISGAVLMPFPRGYASPALDWSALACATFGYVMLRPHLHSALPRHYQTISLALHELRHRGYRRIGLAISPLSERYADGVFTARFLLHLSHSKTAHRLPAFLPQSLSDWNFDSFSKWYRQHKPEAVITINAEIYEWMLKLGVRIPDEAGFACLSCGADNPDWSGVDECIEEVGAVAVDLVVEQLNHNAIGIPDHPKTVQVDGRWVEGKTVRRLALSAGAGAPGDTRTDIWQ